MINIMNEYTTYVKRTLNSYMKYILDNHYDKGIANRYIDNYIEVRYSNYLDEESVKDTLSKKITKGISKTTDSLIQSLPEKKHSFIKDVEKIFKYLYSLDSTYLLESHHKLIENIAIIRKESLKIEADNFVDSLEKMLKEDIRKKREFLNAFQSDMFSITKTKLDKNPNLLRIKVKDKIKFPELYSDIAIEKAKNKDSIYEDILTVGYILTTVEIINNLLSNNFSNTYYLNFPKSIIDKTTKRNRLLTIIDNDFIIEHINLVITFAAFKLHKNFIIELMHRGFIFTISLDKTFDYCSDNLEYLEMFNNIFMLKDKYYYKDMLNNDKLGKRIIIVDEVE